MDFFTIYVKMKECKQCGKSFKEKKQRQVFCSVSCSGRYSRVQVKEVAKRGRDKSLEARILNYRLNPKKCLTCGKELGYLDRKKDYCNRSCAAKSTNVTRVRTVRPKIKEVVIRKCKYCGNPVEGQGRRNVCVECNRYFKISLYKKLGLNTGTLKERYYTALEKLKTLYFDEKKGVTEIWEETGICHSIIKKLFNENGIELRGLSDALVVATIRGRNKIPENFKNQYKHDWHTTWEGKRVFYRSSYELRYALELDEMKIPYTLEELRIRYWDNQLKKERVAIPDFFLRETNEIVEIKSKYTLNLENMVDRLKAYRALGYVASVILDGKVLEL